MAEEKSDGLEGLEDFDDDFGEQLDSFMDSDGEEENDSELDSFFEDLSTIDDLDGDDDSNSKSDNTEESPNEEIKSPSPKSESEKEIDLEDVLDHDDEEIIESDSDKKEKKKGLPVKAIVISSITGILLGIISILILLFIPSTSKKEIPEVVLKNPVQKVPVVKKIKTKTKPKIVKKKKKTTKKITKKFSYDIQVVSCISKECLEDSRIILNSLGYKSRIRNSIENSGIAEVISSNILTEEKSVKITNRINKNNPLAGYAYNKTSKKGYQISLGYFPDLETANRVRTYLNQAFKEDVFFEIIRTSQKINFQVVEVSGLNSKEEAEMLLSSLKNKNPNFESAFIKPVSKK